MSAFDMSAFDRRQREDDQAQVGDAVVAEDGELGRVDTVVRSESRAPLYLVVASGRFGWRRYPVVPCSLIEGVDRERRRVRVSGCRSRLRRLPESLPIAF